MRSTKTFQELAKQLVELEATINHVGGSCNCRPRTTTTYYHSAADLEVLMAVRCPMHGFRELGDFSWVPAEMPLLPEDQRLCQCPPSAMRAFLENKRPYLSQEEHEQYFQTLNNALSREADRRFANDQAKVARLIQQYEDKRNHRRTSNVGYQV